MNPLTPEFIDGLVFELRTYHALCEEVLTLTTRENQALSSPTAYQPVEYNEKRTGLLPRLDTLVGKLRSRRQFWQTVSPSDRDRCEPVKALFQSIQNLLMKILLLDRENQQAMLRRGLVPTRHLPATPVRTPNYVASIYQRNSSAAA